MSYCTTNVTWAVLLLAPVDTVTVIWLVPVGVPPCGGGGGGGGPPPPPQLVRAATAHSTMTPSHIPTGFRDDLRRNPMAKPATNEVHKSEAKMGKLVPRPEGVWIGAADEVEGAVVVMVRMLVAGEPFGVIEGGTNVHCDNAGRPLQEKFTVWLKPPSGVKVNVNMALFPALMVKLVGEGTTLKSETF